MSSKPSVGAARGMFFGKFWASTVAWDILNQLAAYLRPLEREPGAVDALYKQHCDVLEALAEKKARSGLKGFLQVRQTPSAYADSTPLDERRLNDCAYRPRRSPRRVRTSA